MADKEMSFVDHLDELRTRIIRAFWAVAVGTFICWYLYDPISHLILGPIQTAFQQANVPRQAKPEQLVPDPSQLTPTETLLWQRIQTLEKQVEQLLAQRRNTLTFFDVLEPFFLKIQISLVAGLILAFPFVFYQVWAFTAPALYPHEKRYLVPILPAAFLLFAAGVVLGYYILPIALTFLLKFVPPDVVYYQHLPKYAYFFLRMMLGIGLVFQMPVVLMFLAQIEIVSYRFLASKRRHAILACTIAAAIITPTVDPFNMSLLALPLVALYELSIWLVWMVERKRRKQAAPTELAVG